MKAPSIMYGSPPDLFADLDKPTGLEDAHEDIHLRLEKRKFRGLGLSMGRSCFLGLKAVEREDLERAARAGDTAPLFGLLSCEF